MNYQTAFVALDIDQFLGTQAVSQKGKKAAFRLARETRWILDKFNDVIFIIDNAGHFVFVNKASERRTGIPVEKFIGRHFLQLLKRQYHESAQGLFQKLLGGEKIPSVEMAGQIPSGEKITTEVGWTTLYEDNVAVAILGVSRDVTDRKLQKALSEVKVLRGLIPICSVCKKIRDDKGYWNKIESYIREHSEAEFSHGICPGCANKLYPDLKTKD